MQNRVYVICIYVCGMVRMPFKRAREKLFSPKKHGSVRKFLRKYLLLNKQKDDSPGYYGIEDPFPDLISKLRRFMGEYGVPVDGCQEPLVVRMP